jgi:hypothetical protein
MNMSLYLYWDNLAVDSATGIMMIAPINKDAIIYPTLSEY